MSVLPRTNSKCRWVGDERIPQSYGLSRDLCQNVICACCLCTHIYTHTHLNTHSQTHTHTQIRTHREWYDFFLRMCQNVICAGFLCTHMNTDTSTHTHTHTYTLWVINFPAYTCMHTQLSMWSAQLYVHAHVYIHKYTNIVCGRFSQESQHDFCALSMCTLENMHMKFTYIQIHTSEPTHMQIHTHTRIHTLTHRHTYMHAYTHMRKRVLAHTNTHTHTHTPTHPHTHAHV